MWIVDVFWPSKCRFCLVGGSYTIGRKGCDITFPDDPSISRHHATLTVLNIGAGALSALSQLQQIYVADNSKHGTFLNGDRVLSIEERRIVNDGDLMVIGKHVTLVFHYAPVVVCLSPTLPQDDAAQITTTLCNVGGILTDKPLSPKEFVSAQVSPFVLAYCMAEVANEPLFVEALLYGYTLITPAYFSSLHKVLRDTCGIAFNLLPQPSAFEPPRVPVFFDARYARPEPSYFGPQEFLWMSPRQYEHVFRSIHFVFTNSELLDKYAGIVAVGGGEGNFLFF